MEYVPEIPVLSKELESMSPTEIKNLVQQAKEQNCTTWTDFAELPKN